jgi:hypothetical protein
MSLVAFCDLGGENSTAITAKNRKGRKKRFMTKGFWDSFYINY